MASAVLAAILQLCGEMKETQVPCQRLHRRLADVFSELQTMEVARRLPSTEALGQFAAMLRKFRDFLRRHRAKPLYARVVTHVKMMEDLRELNEELDVLEQVLEVDARDNDAGCVEWRKRWEKDRDALTPAIAAVVDSLQGSAHRENRDARTQIEALTVLQYEMQQPTKHSVVVMALMEKLHGELNRASPVEAIVIPPWFIPRDEVEFDRSPFAQGSFGAVHHGMWREKVVVVKTLSIDDANVSDTARCQFVEELDALVKIDHPNVHRIFAACHVTSPPFIVCEEARNGNLALYLGSSKRKKKQLWRLLYETALGLQHLHDCGVVHSGLRLNNILVDGEATARIADHGLVVARALSSSQASSRCTGRLRWRAPECLKRKATFSSDVYSLGMCIIEAATGEPPFSCVDDDTVYHLVRDGEIPERPDDLDEERWNLVQSMTKRVPSERMPLRDVVEALRHFASDLNPTDGEVVAAVPPLAADDLCQDAPEGSITETSFEEQEWPTGDGLAFEQPNDSSTQGQHINDTASIVDLLIALRREIPSESVQVFACVYRKSEDPSNHETLQAAGVVIFLTEAVQSTKAGLVPLLYAFGCLRRLSSSQQEAEKAAFKELTTRIIIPTQEEFAEALVPLMALAPSDEATTVQAIETASCLYLLCLDHRVNLPGVESAVKCVELLNNNLQPVAQAAECALIDLAAAGVFDASSLLAREVIPRLVASLGSVSNAEKLPVTRVLAVISEFNPVCHVVVQACGGIEFLAALLKVEVTELRRSAATALGYLSDTESISKSVEATGAIDDIIQIICGASGSLTVELAFALSTLCHWSSDARVKTNDVTVLVAMVGVVRVGHAKQIRSALRAIASLSKDSETSRNLEKGEAVPTLVNIVQCGTTEQKLFAATALGNMSPMSDDSLDVFRESNGIQPLIDMLRSSDMDLTVAATRVLSNLASRVFACMVMEKEGVVALLVEFMRGDSEQLRHTAVVTLSKMCQHGVSSCTLLKEANGVALFVEMFHGESSGESVWPVMNGGISALAAAGVFDTSTLIHTALIPDLIVQVASEYFLHRYLALEALGHIVQVYQDSHARIVDAHGIEPLVHLLRENSATLQRLAAQLLAHLSVDANAFNVMAGAGAVDALVALCNQDNELTKVEAVSALSKMCSLSIEARHCLSEARMIETLVSMLREGKLDEKSSAAQAMVYLVEDPLACQNIEKTDAVNALLELLLGGTEEQQQLVVHALGNLSLNSTDSLILIHDGNAIQVLVGMLRTNDYDQVDVVLCALANMAVYVPACKTMEAVGTIPLLVNFVRDESSQLQQSSATVLSNMCQYGVESCAHIMNADGIAPVVDLIHCGGDQSTCVDTALRIVELLLQTDTTRSATLDSNAIEALMEVLEVGPEERREKVVRGMVEAAHDAMVCTRFVEAGGVEPLSNFLLLGSDSLKANVLLLLATIARHDETRDALQQPPTLERVVKLLREGTNAQQLYAAQVVSTSAQDSICIYRVIDAGGAKPLLGLLSVDCTDSRDAAVLALRQLSADDTTCFYIARAGGFEVFGCLSRGDTSIQEAARELLSRLVEVVWRHELDESFVGVLIDEGEDTRLLEPDTVDTIFRDLSRAAEVLARSIARLLEALFEMVWSSGDMSEKNNAMLKLKNSALSPMCLTCLASTSHVCRLVEGAQDDSEIVASWANDMLDQIVLTHPNCISDAGDSKALIVLGRRQSWARAAMRQTLEKTSKEMYVVASALAEVIEHYTDKSPAPKIVSCIDAAWASLQTGETDVVIAECEALVATLAEEYTRLEADEDRKEDGDGAVALCLLARHDLFKPTIIAKGAVQLIVTLLCHDSDETTSAATALAALAEHDESARMEIVNGGGVGVLVEMARVGDGEAKTAASSAFASLAQSTDAVRAIRVLGGQDALEILVSEGTPRQRADSRRALRWLSQATPPCATETESSDEADAAETEANENAVPGGPNEARLEEEEAKQDDDRYSDSYCSADSDAGAQT